MRTGIAAHPGFVYTFALHGTWRSMVARLLWVQEVPGSNPGVPTPVRPESLHPPFRRVAERP